MIRASGHVIRHTGRLLHFILAIAMGLLLAATLLLAGVVYRLSQGPINATWVAALAGDAFLINGTVSLSFDHVALAWEGFQSGVGAPIDLRLTNIVLTDPDGHRLLGASRALLTLSVPGLLTGHLIPRRLELDDGLVTVRRQRGGAFNLGMADQPTSDASATQASPSADLRSVVLDFVHPDALENGPGKPGQLNRVRLHNFSLAVRDDELGLTWQAAGAELDLERLPSGEVTGSARVPFMLGDQTAMIAVGVDLLHRANGKVEVSIGTIQPAMMAQLARAVPAVAAVEAPLALHAAFTLDQRLMPLSGQATIDMGAGRFNVGAGHVPVQDGVVTLSAGTDRLVIENAHFNLPRSKATVTPEISLHGTVQRQADRLSATVAAALDHLEIADLGAVWPEGVGGGARSWVLQNVTTGSVAHATASLVAEAGLDLHDVVLTKAGADLDADNVSIIWLDQVPPIERAQMHLHLADPDRLVITAPTGRQRISKGGADLLVQDAQMEITGLTVKDQDARIRLRADGPVASAISLLKEPRLHILGKQSVDLKDASGTAALTIGLQFPLDSKLQAEQIVFQTGAHLGNVRIGKLVVGRDLRAAEIDLNANKDGLTLKGQGLLAAVPVSFDGGMDFNPGPPTQVVQHITVTASANAEQLGSAGINVKDVVPAGEAGLTAVLSERRAGDISIALSADLAAAALAFKPMLWSKPGGVPAQASATLLLTHDRLISIQRIALDGRGFSFSGSADCDDGAVRSVSIDRGRYGRTDMRGVIRLPPDGSVAIALSGPEIDLSHRLEADQTTEDPSPEPQAKPLDWRIDARFDHATLANGESAGPMAVQAATLDGIIRRLDVAGSLASGSPFSVRINATPAGRRLAVDAPDAGAFLRGSGLTKTVSGGRLNAEGAYNDALPTHPLDGTLRIDDSRIVGAPVMGKVLQAMTLYGLSDLLRGPGIGATRIVVPFHYEQKLLRIDDGRLFSASLGLTAKGLVDLSSSRVSLSGTIVPAYVFNSVLGYIPLVGKLFSPETGGGLFAARFRVDGPFSDPTVTVNPLSVLTPGFLRGLFDIGGDTP